MDGEQTESEDTKPAKVYQFAWQNDDDNEGTNSIIKILPSNSFFANIQYWKLCYEFLL